MNLSEAIVELQQLRELHGDLPVCVAQGDGNLDWSPRFTRQDKCHRDRHPGMRTWGDTPERVEIT